MSLSLATGNDAVWVNNLNIVDGNLTLNLGAGNDKLTVAGSEVDGDVTIHGGLGNNDIRSANRSGPIVCRS